MNKAFDQLFGSGPRLRPTVVAAACTALADGAHDRMGSLRPLDDTVVATVRDLPGVAAAEGAVTGYALVLDKDGQPVSRRRPTIGSSLHTDRDLGSAVHVPDRARSARARTRSRSTPRTARKAGYRAGDTVRPRPPVRQASFTLAGTSSASARAAAWPAPPWPRSTCRPPSRCSARRQGRQGRHPRRPAASSVDELRDRVAGRPARPGWRRSPAAQVTGESAKAVRDNLSHVHHDPARFAAVSLLVGAFVIWNTFWVLVAQRRREVALMRAVGAPGARCSPALVARRPASASSPRGSAWRPASVSPSGCSPARASGVDLPAPPRRCRPRTVVVASPSARRHRGRRLVPAAAATRGRAVEALRDAVPGGVICNRRRRLGGVAVLAAGRPRSSRLRAWSAPAAACRSSVPLLGFAGLVFAGPTLARGLARCGPRHGCASGGVGGWRMAARNVARAPQRAAATALALTIGLAVVVAATVVAASMNASVADAVRGGTRPTCCSSRPG